MAFDQNGEMSGNGYICLETKFGQRRSILVPVEGSRDLPNEVLAAELDICDALQQVFDSVHQREKAKQRDKMSIGDGVNWRVGRGIDFILENRSCTRLVGVHAMGTAQGVGQKFIKYVLQAAETYTDLLLVAPGPKPQNSDADRVGNINGLPAKFVFCVGDVKGACLKIAEDLRHSLAEGVQISQPIQLSSRSKSQDRKE